MSAKNAKKARKEAKVEHTQYKKHEDGSEEIIPSDFVLKSLEKSKMTFSKPFGPPIGAFKMSDEVLERMIKLTDEVLEDKERVDWGKNLVGNVNEEPLVKNADLKKYDLYEVFRSCIGTYINGYMQSSGHEVEQIQAHVDHMWVVSQYENEYNPIHFHTYCDISTVLYLKVPEFEDRTKNGKLPEYKHQRDGMIEWVYKTPDQNALEVGTFSVKPEPGMLYVFPSNLLHTVYPFQGKGERRSVAFNAHWDALMKSGKRYDKSMRMKSDQANVEHRQHWTTKDVETKFAKRKQGSPKS
jgi:uncharacterized protein (TIGR02466 family)